MKKDIRIIIDDKTWTKIAGYQDWKKSLKDIFHACVKRKYSGKKHCWIGLLLTDDERIKILNRNFREVKRTTNILSFPEYEPEVFKDIDSFLKVSDIFLGDIAMSHGQIMRECKEYGLGFFDRCSHLFVHGILHLFGADHVTPEEQEEMENMEIEILKEFGMGNPYVLKGEKNNI